MIPSSSAVRSPPVTSATPSAISPIAPVSSSAPTITNRPMKKNSVGHSIPRERRLQRLRGDEQQHGRAEHRDGRGLEMQRLVHEEEQDRADQDRQRALELLGVLDRAARVELHHAVARLGRDLQPRPEPQVEQPGHDEEGDERDRREVDDEVDEASGRSRRRS